jgi:hypothetical protein
MSIQFFVRSDSAAKKQQKAPVPIAHTIRQKVVLLTALAVLFASPIYAQLDTSTITGVITDRSGALVPNATVVITDTKTNRSFTTVTNSRGEYFAPSLSVSIYQVKVSKKGYSTSTLDGVVLHANDSIAENAVLNVGAVSETVTIEASKVQVDTETSNLGVTINASQVSQLPLNGRDVTDLLALVPGAIQNTGSVNNDSLGGFPSGQFGANMLLDGGDSTRVDANVTFTTFGRGNARVTRSSVDNVQEVKVLSSDYSAEYGRAVGDIVNLITKSGSNTMHGEAFEFFRNDALDAKNYFDTGEAVPLRLNQFGGNLGGPILSNKLFYFGNYEGVRQRVTNLSTNQTLVLNQAMRNLAVPAMQPIVALIPQGNGGPAQTSGNIKYGYWFDILNGTTYSDINENTFALKLDYVLSPKNNFAVRYNYNQSNTYGTYGLAIGQYSSAPELAQLGKATWNYIGSETFLNELGFNINSPHSHQSAGEPGLPIWSCLSCQVGLGLTPSPATFESAEPAISYELTDTATKIKGRNQFRFGFDIRWNNVGRELYPQYTLTYNGGPAIAAASTIPCTGTACPSGGPEGFLANNGEGYSVLGYPMTHMENAMTAYFLNDEWKLRRNLTLNLGIRYEFNTVLHDSKGALQNFDIPTLSLEKPGTQLYAPSYVDWAPRLGFNWDPAGKGLTTVKGGFGLFFLPIAPGGPLNIAENTEENLSISLLSINSGSVTCTPPITSVTYPLPATAPNCEPQAPVSVTAFDPKQRDQYAEQWSLSVDQQVARNTVMTIAYRGNRGLRLAGGYNANTPLPRPDGTPLQPTDPLVYRLSDLWGSISYSGQFASSNYNALNVSMRTETHGLNLQASYSWSHEFDDYMGLFEAYQNPQDPKADWSPGDIDVRNSFNVGAVYNAPRIPKLPRRLGEGWQLTTIVQGRTATPVNFGYNLYDPTSTSLRPDCNFGISPRATHWSYTNQFNPAAFSQPVLAYGTCPRNYGRGTNYIQPDMGLVKNTKLTDRITWEFRAEAFDMFNHPNFAGPGATVNGYDFGVSTATIGSLVGQGTSRQLQISSKIVF